MDIASALNALFVALVVFYVCIHSCLTIFEVRTAEASANIVPAAFRFRISLAQHRKAVDYSGELLQCDLVNSILGAAIAVVLTFGGGLSVILAGITAISGQGLASQCILLAGMTLLLALIDLPVAWWRDFRVNERYGFEKTPSRRTVHWTKVIIHLVSKCVRLQQRKKLLVSLRRFDVKSQLQLEPKHSKSG